MKKLLLFLLLPFLIFAEDLVVGTASGYAPYVSLDAQGKYEGFDVDMAELVAQKLGKKLVLKDFGSMPSLMMALKQNKADMLIWAISITEDRTKTMEMVYYQGEKTTEMPILFWKEVSDLKEVCVEAGTFQEAVLKKFPYKIKYVDKISDAVMELKFGKSQATAVDPSLVSRFREKFPEIQVMNLPLPAEEQSLGNGICISKKNQALAAQVQKAVEALKAEGKVAELEKKWGLR
jgi:ABC-type amino acid transport substrate-binding protein